MARRGPIRRNELLPDPVYGSVLVTRFVNGLMKGGKKSVAERIFYGAMDRVKEKMGEDPLAVFQKAVESAKPMLEVKSRRLGGATYQVPVEVKSERRLSLALRWLIDYSRARGERTMIERLSGEFMDVIAGRGGTYKKREDTHRMAEANKAFAHYRW